MNYEELIDPPLRLDETLAEEIAHLDDDAIFEMANLNAKHTGINGTVFVSTVMSSHGPGVKYYAGKASQSLPSFSVSISLDPKVRANSLPPHVLTTMSPLIVERVRLNCAELLRFWNEGASWSPGKL